MKTIILILWLTTGQKTEVPVKVNIGEFCQDAYIKTVIWKDNPNYKQGNYEIWGYYTYNNKPIFAYTCMETDKKTYFYYNKGE
jgi:hypothetical protein